MSTDFDVVIVGAGPAGAAAALAARRSDPGASVLLLDASDFPRDKTCGDGVAPVALDVLQGLGVPLTPLLQGSSPLARLALRSPGGRWVNRAVARPNWVVPRYLFDERLVRAAVGAGAELRRHRVRSVRIHRDRVVLDGVIGARTLIGCDGAESVIRRALAVVSPPIGTVALALRGYAPVTDQPADEQRLLLTAQRWPAYAWFFPIGNGYANVGYGELLRGAPVSRARLEQRLGELLPGVRAGRLRAHRLPLSTGRPALALGPVLLAGDAACLINPLTGEGIFYAVLSGALAGRAATGRAPAASYRRDMRRALAAHLRGTDRLSRLGRWPRLLDAGIAAAAADQRTFDVLVDIGLAAGRLNLSSAVGIASQLLTGS